MNIRTVIVTGLATAALATPLAVASAASASEPAPRKYANCTAMHHVYPHGVARTLAAARGDGHGAWVRPRVYNLNAGSDRDHDGVACEQ
jgi:hypothetical protein